MTERVTDAEHVVEAERWQGAVVPFPRAHSTRLKATGGRVLLLQGPVGPFFNHLSRAFEALGYEVDRVRFNSGDRLFTPFARFFSRRVIDYSESGESWPTWLRGVLTSNDYEMVVLFGGERPAHREAREIAKALNIPVIALEEGYVRSGYVTVERGGNNAASPLAGFVPQDGDETVKLTTSIPSRGFAWMCWFGFLYFGMRNLWVRGHERDLFHKAKRRSWIEVARWPATLLLWIAYRLRLSDDKATIERLIRDHSRSYDLVPLQVVDDAQLGAAARGWSNRELIERTIESFATSAPEDRQLVFKVHPLERGHSRDHLLIRSLAREWGVGDRVHCLLAGPLSDLTIHSRGMIVINSTSGLSAITHGRLLLVLGDAIYRHPALARCYEDERDIDRFWTDDHAPQPRLGVRYRNWLVEHALVPGDYYDVRVTSRTARNVAERAVELAAQPLPADRDEPVKAELVALARRGKVTVAGSRRSGQARA